MPPKKKSSRSRRPQQGAGLFDVIKKVGGLLKDTKLLSKGLGLIPHAGAQTAGAIAGQLGLGRKRKSARVAIVRI